MADERIRELSRRATQGDVQAEARLLKERVRAGELSHERLALAAYLAYPPALEAAPEEAFGGDRWEDWWDGLEERWTRMVRVRAAVAVAESLLPYLDGVPGTSVHRRSLESVQQWLASPDDARTQAVQARISSSASGWLHRRRPRETALAILAAGQAAVGSVSSACYLPGSDDPLPGWRATAREALLERVLDPAQHLGTRTPPTPDGPPDWLVGQRARLEAQMGARLLGPLRTGSLSTNGYLARSIPDGRLLEVDVFNPFDFQHEERAFELHQRQVPWIELSHPNVARVHLVTRYNNQPVFLSEFVPGRTLLEWREEEQRTVSTCTSLVRVLCAAMASLLDQGVRDACHLDPFVVIVTAEGNRPVITGLCTRQWELTWSSISDGARTTGRSLLQPMAYFPPEEAMEGRIEGAVDAERAAVYRLGMILYFLLTGQPAFPVQSARALLTILDEEPPPPASLNSEVPALLDDIVLKCLAKSPNDRYPTPAALGDALKRAVDG